jgi:nitrogen fixation protein FixH
MRFIAHWLLLFAAFAADAQTSPDWKITAAPQKKIMANFDTPMRISVNDGKGKPVSDATVELVLNMIEMDHGEHKWPATMIAPGVYEGKANFFMVGAWYLDVRVKKGSQSKAQKTRIDVKE